MGSEAAGANSLPMRSGSITPIRYAGLPGSYGASRMRYSVRWWLIKTCAPGLGYHSQHPQADLRAWIVDRSIELDGQSVDGFRVVSREVLEVTLRDEQHLLRPLDQLSEDDQRSLFPEWFTVDRFVEVAESGEIWRDIC